jgi:hypothetical protein
VIALIITMAIFTFTTAEALITVAILAAVAKITYETTITGTQISSTIIRAPTVLATFTLITFITITRRFSITSIISMILSTP